MQVVIYMDQELKRNIILDHYQNPRNKQLVEDKSYILENMNNTSCIDEVNVQIKINDDNIVEDVRFDGEACAMCTSSASIMVETLIGKTVDEVKNILINYNNMIDEKEYDPSVLLPWWGIEKAISSIEKNEK